MDLPQDLLLQSQKNQVHALVLEAGFAPQDFDWVYTKSKHNAKNVSMLMHTPSDYWFSFDYRIYDGERQPVAIFSPGPYSQEEGQFCESWGAELEVVAAWLSFLRREVEAPDLWSDLMRSAGSSTSIPAGGLADSLFTQPEKEYISESLTKLEDSLTTTIQNAFAGMALNQAASAKEVIEQIQMSKDQVLSELREQALHQPRHVWRHIALGALCDWSLHAAVPPDHARNLLNTCWHWANSVLTNLPKLLS